MPAYDPDAPLISLHIPKAAGTSFLGVLRSWFPDGRAKTHYRDGGRPPRRHVLAGGLCIHGHFNSLRGAGVQAYYPEARQFITILRDPFDRFVSQWAFLNQEPDFETWIRQRAEEQAEARNARSFVWQLPRPLAEQDFDSQVAELFVFVGVLETFAESVAALAVLLGKPMAAPPRENVGVSGRAADLAGWRPFYERHFADECDIYDRARRHNAWMIREAQGRAGDIR